MGALLLLQLLLVLLLLLLLLLLFAHMLWRRERVNRLWRIVRGHADHSELPLPRAPVLHERRPAR